MTTVADLVWVTFTTTANTPAPYLPLDGRIVGIDPAIEIPAVGTLMGAPGYLSGPSDALVWTIEPVNQLQIMLDSIPGAGGWTDLNSRDTYRTLGLSLLRAGIPRAQVLTGLSQAYSAAITDFQA